MRGGDGLLLKFRMRCPTPCPSRPYFWECPIPPPYLSVYIGNNEMWALAKGCFQTIALWPFWRHLTKLRLGIAFTQRLHFGA